MFQGLTRINSHTFPAPSGSIIAYMHQIIKTAIEFANQFKNHFRLVVTSMFKNILLKVTRYFENRLIYAPNISECYCALRDHSFRSTYAYGEKSFGHTTQRTEYAVSLYSLRIYFASLDQPRR